MENQLHLRISTSSGDSTASGISTASTPGREWELDETTREAGRSGIALARAALDQARRARVAAEGSRAGQPDRDHTTAA